MVRISIRVAAGLCVLVAAVSAQAGDCKKSPRYVMPEEVKYKDGVDAQGWAVAPADVNPPAISGDDLKGVGVELNLPVRQYLDGNAYNLNTERVEVGVGHVNAGMDGSVSLGGKSLNAPDDADCQ